MNEQSSVRHSLICKECPETFTDVKFLKEHLKIHKPEKHIVFCDNYPETSIRERCFSEHKNIHRRETFKYIWCERTYLSKGGLKKHLAFHRDKRWYICSLCGKNFFSGSELQNHKTLHSCEVVVTPKHPEEKSCLKDPKVNSMEKPLKCSVCNKRYAKEQFLKEHMKLHVSKNLFSCSFCYRSFPYDCKLKKHMVIHTKEKQIKCKLCNKAFSSVKSRKKHWYRIHGEKSGNYEDDYQPPDLSENSLSVVKFGSEYGLHTKVNKLSSESNTRTSSFHAPLPNEENLATLEKSVKIEYDCIFNETVFPKEETEDYSTSVRAIEDTSCYSILEKSIKEESDLEIQDIGSHESTVSEPHYFSDIIMVDQFEADVVHESSIDPLAL